jgi:hypothetical protein
LLLHFPVTITGGKPTVVTNTVDKTSMCTQIIKKALKLQTEPCRRAEVVQSPYLLGYRLDNHGTGAPFLAGAYTASYTMGMRVSFTGV